MARRVQEYRHDLHTILGWIGWSGWDGWPTSKTHHRSGANPLHLDSEMWIIRATREPDTLKSTHAVGPQAISTGRRRPLHHLQLLPSQTLPQHPCLKRNFLDSLERIRTGGPYIRRQLGCPTHAASLFSLIAWVGHSRKARTAPPTSAYPGLLIRTPKIIGDFTATPHTRYPKSHDL